MNTAQVHQLQPQTPAQPQTDHAPSIGSSALLAELSIGVWKGSKKDKKASNTITTLNNANKKAARVTKDLLVDCEELATIKRYETTIRDFHRNATLPWSNMGHRLLTNSYFLDYSRHMEEMKVIFYQLVEEFLAVYSWEVTAQQLKLGDMYNAEEYPSVEVLRGKFKIRVNYMPVPDCGDFRVDVNTEAKAVLEQSYTKFYQEQLTSAMADVGKRVLEPLQNMSKMLDYGEGERATGFHHTLVDNVLAVVDVLKACNITQDPKLEELRRELRTALQGVTTDGLRSNPHLRAETKRNVDSIIKNLPSLGW